MTNPFDPRYYPNGHVLQQAIQLPPLAGVHSIVSVGWRLSFLEEYCVRPCDGPSVRPPVCPTESPTVLLRCTTRIVLAATTFALFRTNLFYMSMKLNDCRLDGLAVG